MTEGYSKYVIDQLSELYAWIDEVGFEKSLYSPRNVFAFALHAADLTDSQKLLADVAEADCYRVFEIAGRCRLNDRKHPDLVAARRRAHASVQRLVEGLGSIRRTTVAEKIGAQ